MKLYGLVGVSGSGKSHQAAHIAYGLGADFVVDDGLLIYRGQVIAGYSAKFEINNISAIRRAVFTDEIHRNEVSEAINIYSEAPMLILGTSKKMIWTIAERLGAKGEIEWINICDVSKEEDIIAAEAFRKQGMHAIPVARSQLVEPFVPKFFHRFLQKAQLHSQNEFQSARTIVYPPFSNGAVFVHLRVLRDSIDAILRKGEHPFTLKSVRFNTHKTTDIYIHVQAEWNEKMRINAEYALSQIRAYLRDYLGFPYVQLFLHIDSIRPPR